MESKDYLGREDILKLFIKLSLPAVIAQIVNLLYNMVDRMYIGHIPKIGADALTGVGVAMPVIIIITAFSALLAMGGAPLAAIAMGRDDEEEAKRIMETSYSSLVFTAIILTIITFIFRNPILLAFGASETTVEYGSQYLGIYSLGTIFIMTVMGMNLFINTQGFVKEGMVTILIGAILNIILDPIFIFLLKMGVRGAAIATVISQGISALWVIKFLSSRKSILRLDPFHFKWEKQLFLGNIALGVSPFIMQSTESLLQIAFNTSLSKYGGDFYVGAMIIVGTVVQLCLLPLRGIAQGGQPILSYNYGAKKYHRVRKAFHIQFFTSITLSILFFLGVTYRPDIFARLFTKDEEFIKVVVGVMNIYMKGVFILGVQISCQYSFLALGQAKQSLLLALLRKIVLLIPLIYILPNFFEDKIFAVILAEPVADILAGCITGFSFYIFMKKHIISKLQVEM
ncbi:MAG: MATE family efflux transporter [Tissierellia bacterium]|nr:MATE family efflux transporter [Tissierellia bacterium]